MQDNPAPAESVENQKVLSKKKSAGNALPGSARLHGSRVIRHRDITGDGNFSTIRMIGGDNLKNCTSAPPTIVIEKDNSTGEIRRIIVRCPCGREAEIMCEYDDEEQQQ